MNPTISDRLRKFRDGQKPEKHQLTIQRYSNKFQTDFSSAPAPNIRQSAELRKSVEQRLSAVAVVEEDEEAWVSEIATLLKKSSPRFEPPPPPPLRVENKDKPLEALDLVPPVETQKEFFLSLISRLRGSTELDLSNLTDDDDNAFERIKSRLFGSKAKEAATETDLAKSMEIPGNFKKTISPVESLSWQLTDEILPLQGSLELSKSDFLSANMINEKPELLHAGVQDERRSCHMESCQAVFFEKPSTVDQFSQTDSVAKTLIGTQTEEQARVLVKPPAMKVHVKPKMKEVPLPDYLHPINWMQAAEKEYISQKAVLLRKVYDRSASVTN